MLCKGIEDRAENGAGDVEDYSHPGTAGREGGIGEGLRNTSMGRPHGDALTRFKPINAHAALQ